MVFFHIIVCFCIPVFLCWNLAQNKIQDFWPWLIQVLFVGTYVFSLYFTATWPFIFNYYLMYILVFIFACALFKSCFGPKQPSEISQNLYKKSWLGLQIALILLFSWHIVVWVQGRSYPEESIELDFPLKNGRFYVMHGGNHILINHHYFVPAQKYALDIVQLNFFGFRTKNLFSNSLENYEIEGTTVYSPCDGIVVAAADEFKDQIKGVMDSDHHPAGNYIAIKKENSKAIILMAHLKNQSLLVSQGDKVSRGQPIAQVGNTGNTSEPHLHIHCVMDHSEDWLFEGEGVPIIFSDRFLIRNDLVSS